MRALTVYQNMTASLLASWQAAAQGAPASVSINNSDASALLERTSGVLRRLSERASVSSAEISVLESESIAVENAPRVWQAIENLLRWEQAFLGYRAQDEFSGLPSRSHNPERFFALDESTSVAMRGSDHLAGVGAQAATRARVRVEEVEIDDVSSPQNPSAKQIPGEGAVPADSGNPGHAGSPPGSGVSQPRWFVRLFHGIKGACATLGIWIRNGLSFVLPWLFRRG
jgi:hypothetical protein